MSVEIETSRTTRKPDPSDASAMKRLSEGDPEALRPLMERHSTAVLNFLFRMTGDRGAAEDLAQETFLRLYRSAASYEPDRGFRPWLFAIARNLAINLRRRRRRERHAPLPDDPGARTAVLPGEVHAKVAETLARIEEPYRSALTLCAVGGLSYEEAAEACGCNVKTLSSRLSRARERFRTLMGPDLSGRTDDDL